MESDIYGMRVFARADSAVIASAIANQYVDELSRFCEIKIDSLDRYWKINEYFEILMTLSVSLNNRKTFHELLDFIGSNLTMQKEGEYIWNSDAGSVFRIAETKWVHLERI